jgi:hypothetical protein
MPSPARAPSSPPPGPTLAKAPRFVPAVRTAHHLRLALLGPSGSGKTVTGLRILKALVPAPSAGQGARIAVLDTEHGKATRYAGRGSPFGFTFDAMPLRSYHPQAYIDAIRDAEAAGYAALLLDSFSHAWMGESGVLELVDRAVRSSGGDTRSAWMDATSLHRELMETVFSARLHVIATLRTKMVYVLEPNAAGAHVVRRRGTEPLQRDGIEYDFDIAAAVTEGHDLVVLNTACDALDGKTFPKAGPEVAEILRGWLAPDGPAAEVGAPQHPQAVPVPPVPPLATAPVPPPPPSSTVLGTRSGMSVAEARAKAEIGPALLAATSEDEVEALRQDAALAMPTDPGDKRKRVPSPAYLEWYQRAVKAARLRVAGRV